MLRKRAQGRWFYPNRAAAAEDCAGASAGRDLGSPRRTAAGTGDICGPCPRRRVVAAGHTNLRCGSLAGGIPGAGRHGREGTGPGHPRRGAPAAGRKRLAVDAAGLAAHASLHLAPRHRPPLPLRPEPARRSALAHHVPPTAQPGACVMLDAGCNQSHRASVPTSRQVLFCSRRAKAEAAHLLSWCQIVLHRLGGLPAGGLEPPCLVGCGF